MHIRIRRGLDVPIAGAPEQLIHPGPEIRTMAHLGRDHPGLKPTLLVSEGDRVSLGEPLLQDRADPRLRVTAAGAGVVTSVERGSRRELQAIVIRLEGDAAIEFPSHGRERLNRLERSQVQTQLLESGLWLALRTRPYSKVPRPDTVPNAIFVNAMDTNPLAADPLLAISEQREAFTDGVAVLSRLTDGPLFVCKAPRADVPVAELERVRVAEFDGPHPAGLVGTHIHFLFPLGAGQSVWYTGYQDVIAIGHLFTAGRLHTDRVVALGGPAVTRPRIVRARIGASINDIVNGELEPGDKRVISGSVLSGHRAAGWAAYLGRLHNGIAVLMEGREREFIGWLRPGRRKFSATNAFLSSLFRGRPLPINTSQHGSPRAMIPIGSFERVVPLDILPTQLLRAIVVGDTETAQLLGCMELDEEDLALCSVVCPSKYDYGPALRTALDRIEKEG